MPRYFPDLATFRRLSADHAVIPVFRQLLADHLTPVGALSLMGETAYAFLLESVVGGERVGRFSFLATAPSRVLTVRGEAGVGHAQVVSYQGGQAVEEVRFATKDPLGEVGRMLPRGPFYRHPALPSFTGGLVGYAAYDTVRYYEPDKLLSSAPPDDRGLPEVCFGLYGELVVFDQVDKTVRVVANAMPQTAASADAAYADACRRVDTLVERLSRPLPGRVSDIDPTGMPTRPASSNFTREAFCEAVRRGLEYIRAGDIFQFVPSQRLRVSSRALPLDVYRALRIINPSPYMFYLRMPMCTLIGSSPEILCRVKDGVVTSRPLAGTRRRGATPEEDVALEQELLADPKERAEHIMLVDLHRNDIGRVARTGTVRVADVMTVERYSHVMHIVTDVHGELAEGKTAMDALRASLPVGTVSGAPKIRAMQIIDEVEPTRRGPYGGGVGYLDFSGNMDVCIALRTIVYRGDAAKAGGDSQPAGGESAGRGGEGVYDIQCGAGVVADSVPENEYEETMAKARAMLRAVELAEGGLGGQARA